MHTYKVNEIFYSLQGEGFHTGTPAVFLRFSGCNRTCDFCDTAHQSGTAMTAADIVAECKGYPARHIVVTGGEPLLQLDNTLIDMLHAEGFYIQIETNGTIVPPEGIDWVTCSPKEPLLAVTRADELKVVYQGQDVEAVAAGISAPNRFLQPCSGLNIPETVAYILAHPHWRLSLQTHKLLDIR